MKIVYLGPEGTFTESALKKYIEISEQDAELTPINSLPALFEHLDQKGNHHGFIPLENSIEGPVNMSMDLLIDYDNLYISGEIDLPIELCLLSEENSDTSKLTDIISKPIAIAQCQKYLHTHYPNATIHHASSTAASIDLMKTLKKQATTATFGIIGQRNLITHYNLNMIQENIQDYPNNTTRFGLLSAKYPPPSGNDKTAIVFSSQKDKPGSLHTVLEEFSKRQINLTKINSRPTKSQLGEYLFYIDFEGHCEESSIKEALKHIQEKSSYYKLLGSYRKTML
ncbi:prephenate dehydratase [Candidatus Marinamargulisbacteria bacterium SCGC AG-439-L15]|nr:prephenate dehydratase [Candidatus Marinamargulisbacteria bacterium SCGC AG-439-L15]